MKQEQIVQTKAVSATNVNAVHRAQPKVAIADANAAGNNQGRQENVAPD